MNFDAIPQQLKDHPYWCLWTFEWIEKKKDGTGKWSKRPLSITPSKPEYREEHGLCYYPLSTSDPKAGSTFERVRAQYNLSVEKKWVAGVGILLRGGLCGIDLDDSMKDGNVKTWAKIKIEELDSYTEVSPSGTGFKTLLYASMDSLRECEQVKILGDASLPHRTPYYDGEIEVYDYTSPRFFTITGNRYGLRDTIEKRQEPFDGLYLEAFEEALAIAVSTGDAKVETTREAVEVTADDQEILDRARGAANGDRFKRLYDEGDLADYDGDQSRADLGLCGMLAFWCGPDTTRIDRLFRASKLYREKWERDDYRDWTLGKAVVRDDFFDWNKTKPADRSGEKIDAFFEGRDSWSDIPEDEAELRGGDGQGRSHPVDANVSMERVEQYRNNLQKKNINIVAETDGDPYIFETLCPCCGLDGFFKLSRHATSYECAAGKKSWKEATTLYSKRREDLQLLSLSDVFDQDDEEWLIEDHFNTDVFCEIYGPPGVTKTFLCTDMTLCVATGKPFLDKYPVKKGEVVYLYAEGFSGLKKRIRAWCHQYPDADIDEAMKNTKFIRVPVDFTQDMPTDAFIDLIDAHKVEPVFIVIDTLNRNFGGDENSTADMSAFVRNVDAVRNRYKATTLVVHHTGKDVTKQGRGNSALLGGLSTVIKLEGADKVGEHFQSVVLSFDKVKEGDPNLRYKMVKTSVQYGPNKRDNSLVLLESDETPAPAKETKDVQASKHRYRKMIHLGVIHNECMPEPDATPVSKVQLKTLVDKAVAERSTRDPDGIYKMGRDAIYKYVDELIGLGRVIEVPSPSGNDRHKTYRKAEHGYVDFLLLYGGPGEG